MHLVLRYTSLYGTPTMFIDILNYAQFSTFDVSSLTTGFMSDSPCPIELCEQLIDKMHMKNFAV